MRKNEIIKELEKKIESVNKWEEFTDLYKSGIIQGLLLAIEVVKNYQRRK